MGLPNADILSLTPTIGEMYQSQMSTPLPYLFLKLYRSINLDPYDYRLIKATWHQRNLEDARPFQKQPY